MLNIRILPSHIFARFLRAPISEYVSLRSRRFSFTSLVTGMVLLLLAVGTIGFSAGFLAVNLQYQRGQVDSEGEHNADSIARELEKHPDWLITNPAIERFVQEDHVFKQDDKYENRVILTTDGKIAFAKNLEEPLAWPVFTNQTSIKVDGKSVGSFVIDRSVSHIVHQAMAIFLAMLLFSALIAALLHRFVLRRLGSIEKDLSQNARFDSLTGLPNRRETVRELQRRLTLHQHACTAVFFVDLDKFKAVNDSYGHAVGDEVLKASASRLRSCVRPEDFLGRLAGDEFVILVCLSGGEAVIKRIAEDVGNAFLLPQNCLGREVAMTATVGVAVSPGHGNTAEQLIQHADIAMYSNKAIRRGGWTFYEPAMTEVLDREVHLRAKLKQALQRQEFELHYQPLVRLHDNKTIGAEALIRWRDPESGVLVSPLDFIPELELSGLIVPVGDWVLRTACRQVVQWRKTLPNFHISVNVSARQFIENDFVDTVARILFEERVVPGAIEIELTESMLLDDKLTTSRLAQLKSIGVRLALDDFGTGFSSLGRLASMPFDVIKIDRQFINQMNEGERERSVVVSILALSHGLGMTVLSEGIEQAEQRQVLVDLGCERGQGFLFSRPIPAEAFHATYICATHNDQPNSHGVAIELSAIDRRRRYDHLMLSAIGD